MAPKSPELPRRVFAKGARYYYVVAEGKKRRWIKLSLVKDGLPTLHAALARLLAENESQGKMPSLIAEWEAEVMPAHAEKTQVDERARDKAIAKRFANFHARQVTTPSAVEFLKPYRDRPRTHNLFRAQLRELMRFAEVKGYRAPGSNPISAIRTIGIRARVRCPTENELRRIKVGCLRGDDGKRTRSGAMMACLIEFAYLSGQDVSVMLRLRDRREPTAPNDPFPDDAGIHFRRDKTGKAVVIEWTPRLRAVVARLRAMKAERALKKRAAQRVVTPFLFTKQDGTPLTYTAVANAWRRGLKRSGVPHCMFRDIRAAALTDKENSEGIAAAQTMGTHSTESQTADYVRERGARKTKATR
jgi:integrase